MSGSYASIGSSVGSMLGTYWQSQAARDATRSQSASTAQALAFEREREAERRRRYQEATALNEEQWAAWDARRDALLQRYGIDIGGPNDALENQPAEGDPQAQQQMPPQ